MNPDAALDAALLAAHAAADIPALARLYRQAGETRLSEGKINAGCFYLVQAYIFALDCGADDIPEIHAILVAHGREA
jgi:hypothetical protein